MVNSSWAWHSLIPVMSQKIACEQGLCEWKFQCKVHSETIAIGLGLGLPCAHEPVNKCQSVWQMQKKTTMWKKKALSAKERSMEKLVNITIPWANITRNQNKVVARAWWEDQQVACCQCQLSVTLPHSCNVNLKDCMRMMRTLQVKVTVQNSLLNHCDRTRVRAPSCMWTCEWVLKCLTNAKENCGAEKKHCRKKREVQEKTGNITISWANVARS